MIFDKLFRKKTIPEPKKIVNVIPKLKKGKRGLRMDSNFTIYISDFLESEWRWEIPFKSYLAYKSRVRRYNNGEDNYWGFVTPNDIYINNIVSDLFQRNKKDSTLRTPLEYAQLVLDFVHRFPYQDRKPLYIKYPLETLCENGGNCMDNSVLMVSMLTNMSIDCCFINLPGHVLVGVNVKAKGTYLEADGKKYFLAEATGSEWLDSDKDTKIGESVDYSLSDAELIFKPKK